jgi:hypothetical protein
MMKSERSRAEDNCGAASDLDVQRPHVIVPISPCDRCYAACCRQNGHEFAAILQGDQERRRFAAFAIDVSIAGAGLSPCVERVLPYVDGKCQFLGADDRCTIFDDRPLACRQFECAPQLHQFGRERHGTFLVRNPRVLQLLQCGS